MGKLIISETEKKNILSLYEEDDNKKEKDFLNQYIGKTFIVYDDENFHTNPKKYEIEQIVYNKYSDTKGSNVGLDIMTKDLGLGVNYFHFECLYNPNRIGYILKKLGRSDFNKYYNKTLIDDINQKGTVSGIKWCQKPKADFGVKTTN